MFAGLRTRLAWLLVGLALAVGAAAGAGVMHAIYGPAPPDPGPPVAVHVGGEGRWLPSTPFTPSPAPGKPPRSRATPPQSAGGGGDRSTPIYTGIYDLDSLALDARCDFRGTAAEGVPVGDLVVSATLTGPDGRSRAFPSLFVRHLDFTKPEPPPAGEAPIPTAALKPERVRPPHLPAFLEARALVLAPDPGWRVGATLCPHGWRLCPTVDYDRTYRDVTMFGPYYETAATRRESRWSAGAGVAIRLP